ncbi:MAG: BatD family protein [Candidatus Omnitrophica bacterium]|nr:BatD family protein [Candidatus Omnitrophota bacterium]
MRKVKNFGFLIFIFCFLTFTFCYCDNIQFEVSVDKNKIALGETTQLNFTFHGSQNIPKPKIEKIENFNINYLGPSTVISIVNGKVSTSITHIFSLLPLKVGTFTIGPFSVEIDGKTYTSRSITIEVVSQSQAQIYDESSQSQSSFDFSQLKDRIFLVLEIDKKKLYLNEVVPIVVKLYVNRLGVRDIQFPVIQTQDFSIEKFEQPKQYRQEIAGVIYDVVEFRANLLAIKTGQFLLGPAKLKCNLIVSKNISSRRIPFDDFFRSFFDEDIFEDFFGRYQTYPIELNSIQIPMEVLSLPQENRPQDFGGAIGDFTLEVEATPLSVNVGDPITIKMKIKGEGNFDSVRTPQITNVDGFKVYEPTEKENKNEKVFEQVLIPQSTDIKFIPQINFTFFNPKTSQYKTLSNPPIPIKVLPTPSISQKILEEDQKKQKLQEEEFGKDIVYLKSSLGKLKKRDDYFYKHFNFWLFQLVIFLIFIVIVIFYFEQKKINFDKKYARRQFAYKKAKKAFREIEKLLKEEKTNSFFDIVFKTLSQYLADRFNLAKGVTVEVIEKVLVGKNILNDILEKTKTIFYTCDSARYGYKQFSKEKLKEVFKDLKEIIDYFEKQKYE